MPFDSGLKMTGVLVEHTYIRNLRCTYPETETDAISNAAGRLLCKTNILVHEKIAKQSAEAAGVEAEVEQTFLRLTAGEEDEEVKTIFRKRLLRRAFDELHSKQVKREEEAVNRVDKLMELLHKELEQEKKRKAEEQEQKCSAKKGLKKERSAKRKRLDEEEARRLKEERLAEEARLMAEEERERLKKKERRMEEEKARLMAKEERERLEKEERRMEEERLVEGARLAVKLDEQLELNRIAEEEASKQEEIIAAKVSLAVETAEERAQNKYKALEKLYGELTAEHCQLERDIEAMKTEAEERENERSFTTRLLHQKLAKLNDETIEAQAKAKMDIEREKGFRKTLEAAIDVFRHTEAERTEELEGLRKELELTKSQLEATTATQNMQEQALRKVQKYYLAHARRTKGEKNASYIKRAEDIETILRQNTAASTEEDVTEVVVVEDVTEVVVVEDTTDRDWQAVPEVLNLRLYIRPQVALRVPFRYGMCLDCLPIVSLPFHDADRLLISAM